jgi:hypothetical protein
VRWSKGWRTRPERGRGLVWPHRYRWWTSPVFACFSELIDQPCSV